MKKKWINENYNKLRTTALNITKNERPDIFDDFFHDCLIILMEHKKFEELIKKDEVMFFYTRILLNQWRSNSSPTHMKYRKMKTQEMTNENEKDIPEYDYERDMLIERILNGLDVMFKSENEKHRELAMIILYYHSNGENFTKLGKILNQDRSLLGKKYRQGTKILKEEYLQDDIEFPSSISEAILNSGLMKEEPKKGNEEEEFKQWVLKNRVKFFNPHQMTRKEKEYIVDTYNKQYKTSGSVGCGKCFYKRLYHYRDMYFTEK